MVVNGTANRATKSRLTTAKANATRIESYRLFVLAPPRWLVSPLAIVRSAVGK